MLLYFTMHFKTFITNGLLGSNFFGRYAASGDDEDDPEELDDEEEELRLFFNTFLLITLGGGVDTFTNSLVTVLFRTTFTILTERFFFRPIFTGSASV